MRWMKFDLVSFGRVFCSKADHAIPYLCWAISDLFHLGQDLQFDSLANNALRNFTTFYICKPHLPVGRQRGNEAKKKNH